MAKFTSLWLVKQCRNARRSAAVMEQHKRYGDFVRIAPNHISINNPEAVAEVYGHKSGCLKSEFYDAFLQVTPVVFNVKDPVAHQRKRKYMNPAFSARALADFEPTMDTELLGWKKKLLEFANGKDPTIDFTVWSKSTMCFGINPPRDGMLTIVSQQITLPLISSGALLLEDLLALSNKARISTTLSKLSISAAKS
jgi:cytochrome P450